MPSEPNANPPIKRRALRRSVYLADKVSSFVITLGGLVVIAAVLGIGVYLVSVAVDLFRPGSSALRYTIDTPAQGDALFLDVDEHQSAILRLSADGVLQTIELDTGDVIDAQSVTPKGKTITAFSRSARGGAVAFGYDDGSVQIGTINFDNEFLPASPEPAKLADLSPGRSRRFGKGVVTRTPLGQLRLTKASVDLAKPTKLRNGAGAVILIDSYDDAKRQHLLSIRADGSAAYDEVRKTKSLMGGPPRIRLRSHAFNVDLDANPEPPRWVFITDHGASAVVLWPDGMAMRFDTSDPANITLAETTTVLDPGRRVNAATKLLGDNTIIIGDDAGDVYGYFTARHEFTDTPDHLVLVRAHTLTPQSAAITSIGVSTRDRSLITGDAQGVVVVRNMTSNAVVAMIDAGAPVERAMLTPKVDGVLVVDANHKGRVYSLELRHPEATWSSLFTKVWYEGDPAPSYTYQSSAGDDAAEAKFNLVPLIFGTIKATLYTMLISIPLGILGAIYTSEFLSPKLRSAIKPSIEMMASLPSVVLGLIAAMLLAPMVAGALPGVLLAFFGMPIGVLLAAYLWHYAPVQIVSRCSATGRLGMIFLVAMLAAWVSMSLGPTMESLLFQPSDTDVLVRAGGYEPAPRELWPDWVVERTSINAADARRLRDEGLYYRNSQIVQPVGSLDDPTIHEQVTLHRLDEPGLRTWLDGVIGGAWPGWLLLMFPAAAIGMAIFVARVVDPRLRAFDREHSPTAEATIELIKFLATLAGSAGVAAIFATLLTKAGLDPRDSIFGSYQQRNTLVVGIAMAIAVIPIIYTIADDAMRSVPDSMRSASLGAGATRWQTAVRVVLPVAMSGVFSACMIGLGRASGETMIVLMATGNTPIMSWSIFDGLRTLSANIAVELPEAPKNSTHYRVLFLCGLSLFALTFLINTAAEIVRQRVRKRSASL